MVKTARGISGPLNQCDVSINHKLDVLESFCSFCMYFLNSCTICGDQCVTSALHSLYHNDYDLECASISQLTFALKQHEHGIAKIVFA